MYAPTRKFASLANGSNEAAIPAELASILNESRRLIAGCATAPLPNAVRRNATCFPSSIGAHAQYLKKHQVSLSAGATGQFTSTLVSAAETTNGTAPLPVAGTYPVTVGNKYQTTTTSVGFLTSLQIHPVTWAGLEFNYGFPHYSERYRFNYLNTSTPTAAQWVGIPTDWHEATGAYLVHPKHIPLQPFVGVGGGYIDFAPSNASNQWRGTGLLEVGLDAPVHWTHVGFRVEGRSLFYRAQLLPAVHQHAKLACDCRARGLLLCISPLLRNKTLIGVMSITHERYLLLCGVLLP